SRTVEVLAPLIDRLQAEGYKIVPVSELAGMTRDQAMPPLSPTIALMTDRFVFLTLSYLGQAFYYLFLVAIALGIARLFVLGGLAFWNQRKVDRVVPPAPDPTALPVTVLIPAYNEEVVIVTT